MQDAKNEHRIYDHLGLLERLGIGTLIALFLIGIGCDVSDQPTYENLKPWLLAIWAVLLLILVIPAGVRCAGKGMKSVGSVVLLSLLCLLLILVVFYTCYFWAIGSHPDSQKSADKILNFPPMLAALWVAGVGWYITFQAAAKNHRTTNSFNLIMQTRTSREFLERALQVQLTYPHGFVVPDEDEDLFAASTLKTLTAREHEQSVAGDLRPELQERLFKARGADCLKYLLNYYEFMAVGIEARDLEEELLYDTIGVTVTSVYQRAKVFIDYTRNPKKGDQPLAFSELGKLVERWDKRLRSEIGLSVANGNARTA